MTDRQRERERERERERGREGGFFIIIIRIAAFKDEYYWCYITINHLKI